MPFIKRNRRNADHENEVVALKSKSSQRSSRKRKRRNADHESEIVAIVAMPFMKAKASQCYS